MSSNTFEGSVSVAFQIIVRLLTFVAAFRRCPCAVFEFPLPVVFGQVIEEFGIVF